MKLTLLESTYTYFIFSIITCLCFLFLPLEVWAGGGDGGTGLPWEEPLEELSDSFTGPVALTLAGLGIMGAGATLIFAHQELNGFMKVVCFLVLIISLMVGANGLVDRFAGNGAEIALDNPLEKNTLLAMVKPQGIS